MMEQLRAIHALTPYLALSKSATSPRAAADLVTRATNAPHTYVFAELLQTPQVQALASNPEFRQFYQLLEIFAWGTIMNYNGWYRLHLISPLNRHTCVS